MENKTINQRKELIKELRKLIKKLSKTTAEIAKIADEFGDDYVRRTLIADLEWLLDDADVRDNNNFKVSLEEMKSVTDKYNANPKGYKVNNGYNPRSLADNGLNTVIDMGLMILGTKGGRIS